MSALTSLLVRDRIIPVAKVEDALQQQVLSATDLDTVLLEMNLIPEDVLAAYRAASCGLLPAARDEVMRTARDAIERCPPTTALEHKVVPILLDGRALVLAAADALSAVELQRLGTATGCDVSIRVVTAPRIRAGLAQHYGIELDARTARLVEALKRREPGIIPYVRPAGATHVPQQAGGHGQSAELLRDLGLADSASLRAPRAPAVQSMSVSGDDTHTFEAGDAVEGPTEVPPIVPRRVLSTMPPPSINASITRGARGPLTEVRVAELLNHANHRDDVLYVVMRYSQQFFDYVTLFTISKDGARGRLSHGAGLTSDILEKVYVPLGGSGVLARAAREKLPCIGEIGASDDECHAASLLGQPTQRPGLAVPYLLQGRPVMLVFAEREGEGLTESDAAPLLSISVPVGHALRRIIMESKALSRSSPPGPFPGGDTSLSASLEAAPQVAEATGAAPPSVDGPVLAAVDLASVERMATGAQEALPEQLDADFQGSAPTQRQPADVVIGVPKDAPLPPARGSMVPPSSMGVSGRYQFQKHEAPAAEHFRPARDTLGPPAPAPIPGHAEAPASAEVEPPFTTEPPIDSQPPISAEPASVAEPAGQSRPVPTTIPPAPNKRLMLVPNAPEASVIIDMGEQVRMLVDQLLQAGPKDPMPELRELLRLGEGVLPVLVQRFPGPLWFDISALQVRAPFGRDVSALALALVSFGDRAAPYLATLLGTATDQVAVCALLVAGDLVHPDLLEAVTRRVLDPDGSVRFVALCALRAYGRLPNFPSVVRALSEISERPGKDPRRQRLAVEALGELRDQRALRALIARLGDAQESIAQAAHRGLVELTLQDFGASQRRWETWAQDHGQGHRIEWLIQGLMHADAGVRAVAADELKRTTQQYFGYHPALPKRERELAQRKYREWWEREGRSLFLAVSA
jgi:hypothetical protein